MHTRTFVPAASLVLLFSAALVAQDPVKVDPSHYKVLIDNPTVRVLKISYPAGAKSTMHKHPDSLVVSLADSSVRFQTPDGKSTDEKMPSESARYAPAGDHLPMNVGKTPIDAVLVEFKTPAPGTAAVPTSREGMTMKMLAEGPRAVAYRTTAGPTFQEPAGTKHDYDQVVIALGAAKMSLSIDGKPARTDWKRGDVQFIGRGTPHESKNTGGSPVDYVIVAIK
jgi:mannose-6-phosphate isomerase-like protein (cupin superfamily)